MLSVIPVVGGLKAQRLCTAYDTSFTPAECAQYDSLDSTTSAGDDQGDPDIVLGANYLGEDVLVETTATGKRWYSLPAGAGFDAADTVVFMSAIDTGYCSGNTLAYAWTWQTDQYDRPIFGRINLCPLGMIYFYQASDATGAINTILHELTHTFVFSSEIFPTFRFKDGPQGGPGSPQTPRNPKYPWLPHPSFLRSFNCTDFSGQAVVNRAYFTSNYTVQYVNERGMSCDPLRPGSPYGNCVARMVTPAVQAATRNFFDCPSLAGAELESLDTSPCQLFGSHWDQRTLSADALAPYVLGIHQGFTAVTLALFDDSGFYRVNWTAATALRGRGAEYGHKQGCGYARDTCLATTGGVSTGPVASGVSPNQFPSGAIADGNVCRPDLLGPGRVTLNNYSTPLPRQYRYFASPSLGGSLDSMDYCPYVEPLDTDCSSMGVPAFNVQGQTPGASALCMTTSLIDVSPSGTYTPRSAGCYATACQANGTMIVRVSTAPSTGIHSTVSGLCVASGQTLSFPGYSGSVTCPNVTALCGVQRVDLDPVADAAVLATVAAQQAITPPWGTAGASPTPIPSLQPYPMPAPSSGGMSGNVVLGVAVTAAVIGAFIVFIVLYYFIYQAHKAGPEDGDRPPAASPRVAPVPGPGGFPDAPGVPMAVPVAMNAPVGVPVAMVAGVPPPPGVGYYPQPSAPVYSMASFEAGASASANGGIEMGRMGMGMGMHQPTVAVRV